MAFINENYLKVSDSYLFSTIARKVSEYSSKYPDKKVIRLGIGDVTRPLAPAVIDELHKSVDEMGNKSTFKGYGPEFGYDFLINEILKADFAARGVKLDPSEIIISDGSKSDTGNIGEIFGDNNIVLIPDPVYPVYIDTNTMAGREIRLIDATAENGFVPLPPDSKADIVYLCSPNNPTGAVIPKAVLEKWVEYANKNQAVILFDAAYEAFISDNDVPHSIYEIEGAKKCAIEFRSFSKTAGFTGTRCSYVVVPVELMGTTKSGEKVSFNKLWRRRQATKFNGTPYIIQRAAYAVYSKEGLRQTKDDIAYYMENANIIKSMLKELGFTFFGGENAPYIWLKCPNGMTSWEFFDFLLENLNIVGTPGSGFGKNGEGYFRLTAFGDREQTIEAMQRLKAYYKK